MTQRRTDEMALNDVMDLARRQATEEVAAMRGELEAVREEAFALGVLKKIAYDASHNEVVKYAVLHQVKQTKAYRKGGRTWDQFCEQVVGEPRRTVDLVLSEMRPLYQAFSANLAEIAGVELRQLRLLGQTVSANLAEIAADGEVVIGDERYPLTPEYADDLQAALEALKASQTALLEEKDATLRTKDKLLEAKEQLINRQERELAKLEKEARGRGLTPTEDAFLQRLEGLRMGFDGYMLKVDPERHPELRDDEQTTPRMLAAYLSTLDYLRRQITAAHRCAVDWFGHSDLAGDDDDGGHGWAPPGADPAGREG